MVKVCTENLEQLTEIMRLYIIEEGEGTTMKIIVLLLGLAAVALVSCYAMEYYPDYSYDYPPRTVVYYGPSWNDFVDLAILGTLIWDIHRTDHYYSRSHYDGYRPRYRR
jgi:hypothetical protein